MTHPSFQKPGGPFAVGITAVSSPALVAISSGSGETRSCSMVRYGKIYEGIGALSAGASSRLLYDYKEP